MTRADKIKAYVKERYGVEINETALEQTEFRFKGCDGFECPPECMHPDCGSDYAPECEKCKYWGFWEQEDKQPTNEEKTFKSINRALNMKANTDEWLVTLLTSIAVSLAIIADHIEEKEESDVLPNS